MILKHDLLGILKLTRILNNNNQMNMNQNQTQNQNPGFRLSGFQMQYNQNNQQQQFNNNQW